MSIYGTWMAATIGSGELISAAVDLGRDYDWVSIQIPVMNGSLLHLRVAETLDGTYYDLGGDEITLYEMTAFKNTPIGEDDTEESKRVDAEVFNRGDSIRLGGWRYIKVCCTTEQSDERLIRVRGMRY